MSDAQDAQPFRFFDNRQKYLLFVATSTEKSVAAERIGREFDALQPSPPAFRLFDAGVGDGTVLSLVLRQFHDRWPKLPVLVTGKEISREDIYLILARLADRFFEHPRLVVVLTNMSYADAPWLVPAAAERRQILRWLDVPLTGTTAHGFDRQIRATIPFVDDAWRTMPSPRTGNPVSQTPAAMVLYREDEAFALTDVIPRRGVPVDRGYDLTIVSQPYRARLPAETKVRRVLAPLARALAPGGRMVTVQSTGRDPGMEIIHRVWPDEQPFWTPRQLLMAELWRQLGDDSDGYARDDPHAADAEFTFDLILDRYEIAGGIGSSALLAAWNAAVYVAQIDDQRLTAAMSQHAYIEATRDVVDRTGGLWFRNESFVISRRGG